MGLQHVVSTQQFFDKILVNKLFLLADQMEEQNKASSLQPILKGNVLACVFYEPSTRTRFSFESAMHKLGGRVITTESASHFSSVTKGETLQDTMKVMSEYADVIVLRHPEQGSADTAARVSRVPLINAGDGIGEHPTQALLDLYTIKKELGRIDNIAIACVGDLLNGRTIHSLVQLIAMYNDIRIYLVSPEQLRLPAVYKAYLFEKNVVVKEVTDLKAILHEIDVLYMTRVQKERFSSVEEYNQTKDKYVLGKEMLGALKNESIIMHPLPRVNEIGIEVDEDKRAAYFRQAKNGLYIRMALLVMLLKDKTNV